MIVDEDVKWSPESFDDLVEHLRYRYKDYEILQKDFVVDESTPQKSGNFGIVEFGRITGKGDVAVKSIRNPTVYYKEVWREMYVLMSGLSSYCLNFIGYIIDDKNFSIVTPHIKNGNLEDFIMKLDGTQKTIIAAYIATGMTYLHGIKKIHLDLKPENILLTNDFLPVISDFGSIKHHCTCEVSLKVTYYYTAPEISKGVWSSAADVYSYGIILNRMMNGIKPEDNLKIRSDTPEPLKQLILDCTQPEHKKRPTFRQIVDKFIKREVVFPGTEVKKLPSFQIEPKSFGELKAQLIREFPQYKWTNDEITYTQGPRNNGTYGRVKFGVVNSGKFKGHEVAVKKLLFANSLVVEVWREIQTMILLDSPFATKLYGYFFKKDKVFLVQKNFKLGSLSTHIFPPEELFCFDKYGERLTGTEKTVVAAGLASVLSELEYMGKVHIDLKSDNILLDENKIPALADFGSVKNHGTRNLSAKYTETYAAPELINSSKAQKCTSKQDVYSFGLILNDMMCEKRTSKETVYSLKNWGPLSIIPGDTPEELRNLIVACLDNDPDERPCFSDILALFRGHSVYFPKTDFDEFDRIYNSAMEAKPPQNEEAVPENNFLGIIESPGFVSNIELENVPQLIEDILEALNEGLESKQISMIYDLILKLSKRGPEFAAALSQTYIPVQVDNDMYVDKAFAILDLYMNNNFRILLDNYRHVVCITSYDDKRSSLILDFYRKLFSREHIPTLFMPSFMNLFSSFCGTPSVFDYFSLLRQALDAIKNDKKIRKKINRYQEHINNIIACVSEEFSDQSICSVYDFIEFIEDPIYVIPREYVERHAEKELLALNVIRYLVNNPEMIEEFEGKKAIIERVMEKINSPETHQLILKMIEYREDLLTQLLEKHFLGEISDLILAAQIAKYITDKYTLNDYPEKIVGDPKFPEMITRALKMASEDPSMKSDFAGLLLILHCSGKIEELKGELNAAGFFEALKECYLKTNNEEMRNECLLIAIDAIEGKVIFKEMSCLVRILVRYINENLDYRSTFEKKMKSIIKNCDENTRRCFIKELNDAFTSKVSDKVKERIQRILSSDSCSCSAEF